MDIVEIAVKDLKPYRNNAKKHDQIQIDNVAMSIKKYGFVQPIVVDKNNEVIIGHCRLLASKKLGMKKVPCVMADTLTEEQVKELRLLDNKLNESDWDFDLVSEELEGLELGDFDLDWGLPELVEEEKEVEEDEFDCTPPEQPKAKLGDIYQLGNNRLMCGDSTKEEDVAKLMDGKLADLVVTDPPYNVNIGQGGGSIMSMRIQHHRQDGATIKNDNMDDSTFYDFLRECFSNMNSALKDGGVFYVWHGQTKSDIFIQTLRDNQLEIRQMLIWNKNRIVMGRQDYQWKHEGCVYGWKDGASHNWYGDRKQTTIIDCERPTRSDLHPTMKPIKLFDLQIKNSSKKDDIVLDLFGGSGPTLIACEQLNRNCYMMELDPKYVQVIIERYIAFTGKEVYRLNPDGSKTNWNDIKGEL